MLSDERDELKQRLQEAMIGFQQARASLEAYVGTAPVEVRHNRARVFHASRPWLYMHVCVCVFDSIPWLISLRSAGRSAGPACQQVDVQREVLRHVYDEPTREFKLKSVLHERESHLWFKTPVSLFDCWSVRYSPMQVCSAVLPGTSP